MKNNTILFFLVTSATLQAFTNSYDFSVIDGFENDWTNTILDDFATSQLIKTEGGPLVSP